MSYSTFITSHLHIFRCDMYLHVVDKKTLTISTIPDILKLIDSQYDLLKDYHVGFAIENIVVRFSTYLIYLTKHLNRAF